MSDETRELSFAALALGLEFEEPGDAPQIKRNRAKAIQAAIDTATATLKAERDKLRAVAEAAAAFWHQRSLPADPVAAGLEGVQAMLKRMQPFEDRLHAAIRSAGLLKEDA